MSDIRVGISAVQAFNGLGEGHEVKELNMSMRLFGRQPRAALAVVGTVLFLLTTSSPEAGSGGGVQLFTGGGFGPTPAVAVQSAIWDAEVSASGYQLFTCQLVGEPLVFPRNDSLRGPSFSAEATLYCTP